MKFIIGQFCRESRLPFSQITVPFTEKRLQRAESGIKDGFEEMEHEFNPEKQVKQDYLFQMFRYSGKFFAGATQEVVFHLLPNRIIRKMFVNGEQPK